MGRNYGAVGSVDELAVLVDRLHSDDRTFTVDLETGYHGPPVAGYSLHPETAFITGFSLTNSTSWARYAPLAHDVGENLDNRACARLLWPLLATGRGVPHGGTFELRHLSRWFRQYLGDDPQFGEQVRATKGYFPLRSDTMIEEYVLAGQPALGLKALVQARFGHQMTELHELFGPDLLVKDRKFMRFNVLDPADPKVVDYACEDALWTLALHERNFASVVDRFIYKVEMAVMPVVCGMEDFGVVYDWGFLREAAGRAKEFLTLLGAEVADDLSVLAGEPVAINLGSWVQLSKVLYDQLGFKTTRYTKSSKDLPPEQRKMSTDKVALAGLAKEQPVVARILEWKRVRRLLSSYLEVYEKNFGFGVDGRTHPDYMQAGTVTGRFATKSPNVSNSPKKYHIELRSGASFDLVFRDAIIVPDGYYALGFDYAQQELRVIAGEAKEPALLRAFAEGVDVHVRTAALMLGKPEPGVTDVDRNIGKMCNFALSYQMGAKGLADRLGISAAEAQALFDQYFRIYPAIKRWADAQVASGYANGYIMSKFNRKIPIWDLLSEKKWQRQMGERFCVNAAAQGGGTGDVPKIAMIRAHNALVKAGLDDRVHLVMNIHDALEWYVRDDVPFGEVIEVLQPAVVFPVDGWPPMVADWHIWQRWGSMRALHRDDDGQWVTGEEVQDERPEEDEDEIIPVTRPAAASPPALVERPSQRQVRVTVSRVPTEPRFKRLQALLRERPGPDQVVLVTPLGSVPLQPPSAIGPDDVAVVSMLLGGAQVAYGQPGADAAAESAPF